MPLVVNQRYVVRDLVGSGEMGHVLRVEDRRVEGPPLAMKLVKAGAALPDVHDLFRREFMALADLDHPALARAYEFEQIWSVDTLTNEAEGEGDAALSDILHTGLTFFVRDFVNGRSILEASSNLALDGKLNLLAQLAQAVAYIHNQGLLHQDLKPENIFVTWPTDGASFTGGLGQVRLLDFGFVNDQSQGAARSGTAEYLAPEVLRGGQATIQSELYALGLVMQVVLTGTHPLAGYRETVELVKAQLHEVFEVVKAVPPELSELISALLAKEPAQRPADAQVVLNTLKAVIEARDAPRLPPPVIGGARLVGRAAERGMLTAQINARAGEDHQGAAALDIPSAVIITGPPGAGKSRLVSWMRTYAQARGLRIFGRFAGDAPGRGVVSGWQGLFRSVLADRRSARQTPYLKMLEAAVQNREIAWAGHLPPEDAWSRLREAGVALLAEEGRTRPLVLIFEDLHGADPETVEWFEYLSRNLPASGALIVGTAWPPGPTAEAIANLHESLAEDAQAHWVSLDGLDIHEVQILTRRLLGVSAGVELAERLRDHTDGNPLFLEELIRGAGGIDQVAALVDSDQVPGAVGEASRAQLERLPTEGLRCLQGLAVLGRPATEAEVARVLDESVAVVHRGLRSAAKARLIRVDGHLHWFVHGMLAQVCEGDRGDAQLASFHRRAASLAGQGDEPLFLRRIARHWRYAGETSKAICALVRGAVIAERRFQVRLATNLYTQALKLAADDVSADGVPGAEVRWRLRSRLAQLLMWSGSYTEAEGMARSLLESPSQGRQVAESTHSEVFTSVQGASAAELWSLMGQISTRRADYDAALERFGQGLAEAEGLEAARVLDHMAEVHLRRGATDQAEEACSQALVQLSPEDGGEEDAVVRGAIETHLGRVAQARGRFSEALDHLSHARDLYERAHHVRGSAEVIAAIAGIYEVRNEPEEAVAAHLESLELSDRAGDVEGTAATLHRLGMAHYTAGDAQSGVDCLERSLELYRQLNNPQGEARALNGLGVLNHVRGAYRGAIIARTAAIELQEALGDATGLAMTQANLAILYYQIGAHDQAMDLVTRALNAIEVTGQMPRIARCRYIRGMVCSASGDFERAERELLAAEDIFKKMDGADFVIVTQAGLTEHWIRVGSLDKARVVADAAMARARSLGRPALMEILVTRARLLLAERETDADAMIHHLSQARIIATKLNYADYLCQVFELWGRLMLKTGRPTDACGWLTRAMDVVYACHQRLPEDLQAVFVSDPRRQVVHNALELALKQAQRGSRRRAKERHEPGIL